MAGETSASSGARLTGRVWLVLLCATGVIVFLGVVLPGVFDVKHGKRNYVISAPVGSIAFDSKGTINLDISPSRDGRVYVTFSSEISKDSRLLERHKLVGKTLTLTSACTGSRLGILKRCDFRYHLRVPRDVSLSLRVHLGQTTVRGVRGRLDFKSDVGDFSGSGCNARAYFSLGFGHLGYRDSCTPTIVRVRVRAGGVDLTVPPGRYDVRAHTHFGGGVNRPFENIIEDPSAPSKLDVSLHWGGAVDIKGASS